MKKKTKIKSILVIGKRWFDKINGNTYCSSRVYINGEFSFSVPYEYGYERFYEQRAQEIMKERGMLPDIEIYPSGILEPFWQYCNRKKIKYETSVTDGLKRDCKAWGENEN